MVSYAIDTTSTVLSRAELGLPGCPAEPTTETETLLLSLWCEILLAEGLGIDDDFFASGGDSFAAATLITAIEKQGGVSLPASGLIASPTPRLLAVDVERALVRQAHRSLVPLNSHGAGASVFCVHGMTGEAYAAKKLHAALGTNRKFYGFRAQGLGDGERPLSDVNAIVERYISEMQEAEPDGPYVLAGWCGGALVAYEMGRQLKSRGQTVAGIVMVDPPADRDFAPWLSGLKPGFSFREHTRRLERKIRRGLLLRGRYSTFDQRRYRVEHAFHKGLTNYVPGVFDGPALLLYSEDLKAKLDEAGKEWERFGCPNLTTACISRYHADNFDKSVHRTAEEVRTFLDRVAPLEMPERGVSAAS
jgi:acyl carrier protein